MRCNPQRGNGRTWHGGSPMTETRYRHPYIGRRRTRISPTGNSEPLDQRNFAAPLGAIKWTMADQARAVERGYFLKRDCEQDGCRNRSGDNHARVLPLDASPYASDTDVMSALEA